MKIIFKTMLPVAAFILASAGAVNTTSPKKNATDARKPPIAAFVQNGSSTTNCTEVTANCSEVNTHQNCMSIEFPTRRAYLKDNGACVVELWRVL